MRFFIGRNRTLFGKHISLFRFVINRSMWSDQIGSPLYCSAFFQQKKSYLKWLDWCIIKVNWSVVLLSYSAVLLVNYTYVLCLRLVHWYNCVWVANLMLVLTLQRNTFLDITVAVVVAVVVVVCLHVCCCFDKEKFILVKFQICQRVWKVERCRKSTIWQFEPVFFFQLFSFFAKKKFLAEKY